MRFSVSCRPRTNHSTRFVYEPRAVAYIYIFQPFPDGLAGEIYIWRHHRLDARTTNCGCPENSVKWEKGGSFTFSHRDEFLYYSSQGELHDVDCLSWAHSFRGNQVEKRTNSDLSVNEKKWRDYCDGTNATALNPTTRKCNWEMKIMIPSIFTIAHNSNEAYDLGDHLSLSMTSCSSKLEQKE